MARSKPQTNFYLNYGPVTTSSSADALAPVLIAPRYALHSKDRDDSELLVSGAAVVYSGAAVSGIAWPNATSGAVVDTSGSFISFYGPEVQLTNSAAAVASSGGSIYNTLSFSSAISGADTTLDFGYQLRTGDKLVISGGSTSLNAGVVNVYQQTVAASGGLMFASTQAAVTEATVNAASYTFSNPSIYAMTVTSVGSDGAVSADVSGVEGDIGYNAALVFSDGVATAVGNHNLQLTFSGATSSTIPNSSLLLLNCQPRSKGDYTEVTINKELPAALQSGSLSVQIRTSNLIDGEVDIPANFVTMAQSGIALAANATVPVYSNGNATSVVVTEATAYANYRELLQTDVNELISASQSDIASWVGPTHPDNPLGMLYLAAIGAGSTNFYLMATSADTDDAYITALNAAGKVEAAYALYPVRQTANVLAAAETVLAYYSKPSVAQVKRLWIYSQDVQQSLVLGNTTTSPVLATVSADGVLTLTSGSFSGSGVAAGNKVILSNVYDASTGSYSDLTYTITALTSELTAAVSPSKAVSSSRVANFYKVLTPTEYAQKIAASAAAINNSRINYIYCEANTVGGYSFEDARYVAPVLAAMRAAMAPHAPLTDVSVPSVSVSASVGFSEDDLDIMNDSGVWIVYRDNRGECVSRHSITTGGEGTIAEEDSAVSNGDNILRYTRNAISFLRGNCNVTDALVSKLRVNVIAALGRIKERVYSDLIGSQIITIESVTISRDANNTAKINGVFNLDLPDVYLDGEFTFNLF